jgi:hypothetical protein
VKDSGKHTIRYLLPKAGDEVAAVANVLSEDWLFIQCSTSAKSEEVI